MSERGINKLFCVLEPSRIPGADSVEDTPPDAMHIFLCGLTRIEGAHMLEFLFKPNKV